MRHYTFAIAATLITSFASGQDYYKNIYEAESSIRQRRFDEAISYYQKAAAVQPFSRDDAYNLTSLYCKLKDSANAVRYFQLALDKGQGSAEWIVMDPDLSFVRSLPVWNHFLQQAKQNDETQNEEITAKQKEEQYDLSKTFSPRQLKEDIALLRKALEEAHPGMYWYTGKATWQKAWSRLEQSAAQPQSVLQFFPQLVQTLNNLHDVHSETTLPQPVFQQFIKTAHFFPIPLKFIGDKAFVSLSTANGGRLNFGDEILALNKVPMKDIHKNLLEHIVSDGFAMTGKQRVLNKVFYRWYTLVYQPGDSVLVTYQKAGEKKQRTTWIKTADKATTDTWYKLRYPELNDSLPARFFYTREGIPVLKVNTFGAANFASAKMDYYALLDSVFTTLQQQKRDKFIIDLRQNNGGDESFLQELVSYLVDKPIEPYKYASAKTKNFSFLSYTDDYLTQTAERMKIEFQPNEQGVLVRKSDWAQLAGVKANNYKGKLVILIGGLDVSAGSTFPSLIYQNRPNTTFVGEETGGGFYGNNSSYYFNITLPNTKIHFRLPLVQLGLNTSGMPKGHGLMPQYTIIDTLQDLQKGNDAALVKAVQLFNGK